MNPPASHLTAALAGNPNAGKTTLFNALTGARQHVGNYPGITVDKKVGVARAGDRRLTVVDLPGTYSLTAYTQEELVARKVLVEERPDVVVDVLNATVLERNLYLAVQLMEMGLPLVLALNMMDEVRAKGMEIDLKRLSELLGVPVVGCTARNSEGVRELVETALDLAEERRGSWRPLHISYGPDLDPVLSEMVCAIEREAFLTATYPPRWLALKYLEGDEEVLALGRAAGPLAATLEAMAAKVADHCQKTLASYPEALIADYRYGFIASVLKQGVILAGVRERIAFSDSLDRVLTHKVLGPVLMFAVLYGVYELTFRLGAYPMDWLGNFFGLLGDGVTALLPEGLLRSLLVSGVIDGVGGVLSFVPLILIIFMLIAFLEDSGYMARIAYMLDRVFRTFGLHGCSVMPFIVSGGIAGGCAVPGVMAARTLRSQREKLATILTAPFMTCGAKLPVFILLVGVFFPDNQAQALFGITLTAWLAALLVAKLLRATIIRGPSTPFVMELPPYRLPTLKGLVIHTWERTWQYIKKAGTVILAISVILWAAMTFPGLSAPEAERYAAARAELAARIEAAPAAARPAMQAELETLVAGEQRDRLQGSLAGRMGTALEKVTALAGFDWRTNIALIGGFAAKEVIVSTLATAYSLGEVEAEASAPLVERLAGDPAWTLARGVSLILFIMLYAPCFVTVLAIRQESGSWKWAAFSLAFNTLLAFALAAGAYQLVLRL